LTVRRPVERALDVGTGCGIQALLAAKHARQVLAVDLNPRATWLTRLNCQLNGIHNVDCREGSLFEPVAGMDFDLIVSNPPFVISPDRDFVFRDGGQPGDAFSRGVVAQAAQRLREGGFASILCNWIHRNDQDWWVPLAEWVNGCGCDAWLLHYHGQDPLTYAAQWQANLQASDPAEYGSALDRWREYYRQTGVDFIASGAVVMRKRSSVASNWVRWDEMPRPPVGSGSDHILRVFDAYDVLARMSDDAELEKLHFRLVDGHAIAQRLVYRDGVYAVVDTEMALEEGVGLQASIPAAALPLVLRLDGAQSLQAQLEQVADTDTRRQTLRTVRELFSRGLITVAE